MTQDSIPTDPPESQAPIHPRAPEPAHAGDAAAGLARVVGAITFGLVAFGAVAHLASVSEDRDLVAADWYVTVAAVMGAAVSALSLFLLAAITEHLIHIRGKR